MTPPISCPTIPIYFSSQNVDSFITSKDFAIHLFLRPWSASNIFFWLINLCGINKTTLFLRIWLRIFVMRIVVIESWAGAHIAPSQRTYELTDTEAACTGLARVCKRWRSQSWEKRMHTPPLVQKLSPIDNYLQMKISFSPKDSHWRNKLILRVG